MALSVTKKVLHASAMALIVSGSAATSLFVTADAAYAERGGNGNGRGNSDRGNRGNNNRDRDRDRDTTRVRSNGNGNGNGNGRGAVASELKWMNAANANQRALENASPNSTPGQLYAYQSSQRDAANAQAAADNAQAEFDRLVGLSEDEIAAEFPNGGYEDAVTNAANTLAAAEETAAGAQENAEISLTTLTRGRTLSEAALAELNRLLGL